MSSTTALFLASAAAQAPLCTPNNPGPITLQPICPNNESVCVFGQDAVAGPAIQYQQATSFDAGEVLSFGNGLAFQVAAWDEDIFIHKCIHDGETTRHIRVADIVDYQWTFVPMTLPGGGAFRGLGLPPSATWQHPAAQFFLDPNNLPSPNPYTFRIVCTLANANVANRLGVNDPVKTLTWEIQVEITSHCRVEIQSVVFSEQGGIATPPPPPQQGVCCSAAHFWHQTSPILPSYNTPFQGPDLVPPGEPALFAGRHEDVDKLERCCDDNPPKQCDPLGTTRQLEDSVDSLRYDWIATGGSFLIASGDYAAVWTAPSATGLYDVCVEVNNRGVQINDAMKVTAPFPIQVLVMDIGLRGKSPQSTQWIEDDDLECGLPLWRNDDDDNQDAVPDQTTAATVAGEDDLAEIEVPGGIEMRVNLLAGNGIARLWGASNKSANLQLNQWVPSQNFFVEGLVKSAALNDVLIAVDLRSGLNGNVNVGLRKFVRCTVFVVETVTLSTANDATVGNAESWETMVHPDARPDNLDVATNRFYIEPDPRLLAGDVRPAAGWDANRRNEVLVTATIAPPAGDVKLHVRPFDVDDATLPETINNYVDDTPDANTSNRESDNHGTLTGPAGVTKHGLLRDPAPPNALRETLTIPTGKGGAGQPALGSVQFHLATTLAAGDNFRVLVTLAPNNIANAGGQPRVMAPLPAAGPGGSMGPFLPDFTTSKLAYRRAGTGYVRIPEGTSTVASQSACSADLVVRRVLYIEDEWASGIPETFVEGFSLGYDRSVASILPDPANANISRVSVVAGQALIELGWAFGLLGLHYDQSVAVPDPPLTWPPTFGLERGPLQGGRMALPVAGAAVLPIEGNSLTVAFLSPAAGPAPASIAYSIENGGGTVHSGFFRHMHPALGPNATTGFVLTAAVPGGVNLVGASIRVGSAVTALHGTPTNAGRTELYTAAAGWSFPVRFFGDDSGTVPSSEIDLMGSNGIGPWGGYRLIDFYLRNIPVRIAKLPLGYSEVWPFAPTHLETLLSPFLMKDFCRVVTTDGNGPSERLWTYHKFIHNEYEFNVGAPIAVAWPVPGPGTRWEDGDMDADIPAVPANILDPALVAGNHATQVPAAPAGTSYVPALDYPWVFTAPEEDREIYARFYPAIAPTALYHQHNATRLDIQRARGIAHELLHSFSDAIPPGSLPARGDNVPVDYDPIQLADMHGLPGVSSVFGGDDAGTPGPFRLDFDPILGGNVQFGYTLDQVDSAAGPLLESDTAPYLIWHARRHARAPFERRP